MHLKARAPQTLCAETIHRLAARVGTLLTLDRIDSVYQNIKYFTFGDLKSQDYFAPVKYFFIAAAKAPRAVLACNRGFTPLKRPAELSLRPKAHANVA